MMKRSKNKPNPNRVALIAVVVLVVLIAFFIFSRGNTAFVGSGSVEPFSPAPPSNLSGGAFSSGINTIDTVADACGDKEFSKADITAYFPKIPFTSLTTANWKEYAQTLCDKMVCTNQAHTCKLDNNPNTALTKWVNGKLVYYYLAKCACKAF